ncbi:carboxymuconolactone decarboxylase family protein [Ruania halotolerans]|uniref:carboxymuconolactone decarboxylase family protein n=1 Tax=Ruania halotolerans TaxID=2897773 RepID=UPI001E2D2F06|nr:carboxymuconolactone decarboxylase family protein [Ruania halotolerans]UFU07762.1 carboxymuconolactone decarboxylase family protein [Ruania halotolerans]
MTSRTPTRSASPEVFRHLMGLDALLADSLGPVLHGLVQLRASQINGCAYCVDLHSRTLERHGVPYRTIFGVGAWHESPFFDETQRVALTFTEALTGGIDLIDDETWQRAGDLLGERGRADLVVAIGTINTMNMSGISTHLSPTP